MSYRGEPGGPRDPTTPGGYCLARCYCQTCPQYPQQHAAAEMLREQEYAARDRKAGQRAARRDRTSSSPRRQEPAA